MTQPIHKWFWIGLIWFQPKYINDPTQTVRIGLGQFAFTGDPYLSYPKKKTSGSRHQRLFEENVRKNKRGLQILKRRVHELFTHREGISIPCACHKGQHTLIERVKHDFKIIYFTFFIIIIFFESTWVLPLLLLIPRCNEEIRHT